MDLTGCDAYFLLVEMEGRVFVTGAAAAAASTSPRCCAPWAAAGIRPPHPRWSRTVRWKPWPPRWPQLSPVRSRRRRSRATPSSPARRRSPTPRRWTRPPCAAAGTASAEWACSAAADLTGRVALADLERASAHGLGHAPVKAVMTTRVPLVWAETPLERVALRLAQDEVGWLPVVEDEPTAHEARRCRWPRSAAWCRAAPWPGRRRGSLPRR